MLANPLTQRDTVNQNNRVPITHHWPQNGYTLHSDGVADVIDTPSTLAKSPAAGPIGTKCMRQTSRWLCLLNALVRRLAAANSNPTRFNMTQRDLVSLFKSLTYLYFSGDPGPAEWPQLRPRPHLIIICPLVY